MPEEDSALFLQVDGIVPRVPENPFHTPFSFKMRAGECWTFYGDNGSGKTLLAETLYGKYALNKGVLRYPFLDKLRAQTQAYLYPKQYISYISFQSTYAFSDFRDAYYQQRFNSQDADLYPTVSECLGLKTDNCDEYITQVVDLLRLSSLLEHRLVALSSGQLRRLLIAKALLARPKMMIFDNPFIGLDQETRERLNAIFVDLSRNGVQLLFLIPALRDIPPCCTHLLYLVNCETAFCGSYAQFLQSFGGEQKAVLPAVKWPTVTTPSFEVAVKMEHLNISYKQLCYQHDLCWEVRRGQKWALLGPNGSGKSTLLSYVFADNPQAYRLPLWLFDRKRGSGESIWDIKRRIGYTSSEMHLYYRENVPCLKVVQSGFFDSVGLFRQASEAQTAQALQLMEVLGISSLKDKLFMQVSSGQQRLLLFARSLVKNPELLILDEPFHGMDYAHKQLCLRLIDSYCAQPDRTMIFVTHYQEELPQKVEQVFRLQAPQF